MFKVFVGTITVWKSLYAQKSNLGYIAIGLVLSGCMSGDFDNFIAGPEVAAEIRKTSQWANYAGSGSRRATKLEQINKDNVADLEVAWTFRTGDLNSVFQSTPILVNGQLVLCTPHNQVIALDPLTGAEFWRFDPEVAKVDYPNQANCRAVAQWRSNNETNEFSEPDQSCKSRIFVATNDARLIAIDGTTGQRCKDFGESGEVLLKEGVGELWWPQEYQVTSPPSVIGDVVVVGSAIADNQRVDAPSGVVRGFDAQSGELVWAFDLAPPNFDYTKGLVSDAGYALATPNVWAGFAIDPQRDLIFLPTGNPAPDYYREGAEDMGHYGSSIVALRGTTGEYVWHFQTVKKDFWDFDVPSIPSIADIVLDGVEVPALIQSTKMGFIFVLNRETGEPLIDVSEQAVPRYGPLAEELSPTQVFPPKAFQLSRSYEPGGSLLNLCNGVEKTSRIGDVYDPITTDWTIGLPSNMGASSWGGVAVDEQRGLIVAHVNNLAFRTKLISTAGTEDLLAVMRDRDTSMDEQFAAYEQILQRLDIASGVELGLQLGTDFYMAREMMMDPYLGVMPCAGPPFGELLVLDLNTQKQVWRQPHGSLGFGLAKLGLPQVGGPLLSEAGFVVIGSLFDSAVSAYDTDTGKVLWRHDLPSPANSIPMSYSVEDENGRQKQFIVMAAGGDSRSPIGSTADYLVAFALPE